MLLYGVRALVLQSLISLKLIWQKLYYLFLQPRDLNLAVDLQVKWTSIVANFDSVMLNDGRFPVRNFIVPKATSSLT